MDGVGGKKPREPTATRRPVSLMHALHYSALAKSQAPSSADGRETLRPSAPPTVSSFASFFFFFLLVYFFSFSYFFFLFLSWCLSIVLFLRLFFYWSVLSWLIFASLFLTCVRVSVYIFFLFFFSCFFLAVALTRDDFSCWERIGVDDPGLFSVGRSARRSAWPFPFSFFVYSCFVFCFFFIGVFAYQFARRRCACIRSLTTASTSTPYEIGRRMRGRGELRPRPLRLRAVSLRQWRLARGSDDRLRFDNLGIRVWTLRETQRWATSRDSHFWWRLAINIASISIVIKLWAIKVRVMDFMIFFLFWQRIKVNSIFTLLTRSCGWRINI